MCKILLFDGNNKHQYNKHGYYPKCGRVLHLVLKAVT